MIINSNVDVQAFFLKILDKCLTDEGFRQASIDRFPNRYKAVYIYDHLDLRGDCVSSSLVEINGIPVGGMLACYARVLKTDYPLSCGENVRCKLRLDSDVGRIQEQFKHSFINRIKDLFSLGFGALPMELLYVLVNYLSIVDLVNLSQVNRRLYYIVKDNYLWRKIYQVFYGSDLEHLGVDIDWKEMVKLAYLEQKQQEDHIRRLRELHGRSLPTSTILLALPPPQSLIMAPPLLPIPVGPMHFHRAANALLWNPFNDNRARL